ncbi:type VII secretion protein EssA [Cytobacillus firmus]|uniref:Type VII secretion protein EssA n=2 Tax=Cytobacillus TaxID=2675230 RepID=A0A366JKM5_CYTFI|nr:MULTISPECIES: type VII secretion protein EssA [Cytobacillus]RBP87378.1 type VII secretion protein EssA [Cytobacillus firmus]TDX37078.1 type VII secretion protein EssA [Cytobacillus oceanisediminis]
MKLKRFIKIILLIPAFWLIGGQSAGATPDFNNLTPNTYEKKEFKENTDYLHEKSLYENKKEIPEEQKDLTFTKKNLDPLKEVKEQLFDGGETTNNTITAKADQLQLFSDSKQESFLKAEDQTPTEQDNKLIFLYIILFIIAIGVIMGFLIPRMAKQADN